MPPRVWAVVWLPIALIQADAWLAAAETLSVTPTVSSAGRTVTVEGTGWSAASGAVSIYLSRTGVFDESDRVLASGVDASSGAFSREVTIPDAEPGDYTVLACQVCGDVDGFPSQTTGLTIEPPPVPAIRIDPMQSRPGRPVTAIGTGWDPRSGDVSLFADASDITDPSTALATFTVRPVTGGFSGPVEVPDSPVGDYTWFACQRCGDVDGFPRATTGLAILAQPTSATVTTTPTGPTTPTITDRSTAGLVEEERSFPTPWILVAVVIAVLVASLLIRRRVIAHKARILSGEEEHFEASPDDPFVRLSPDPRGPDHGIRLVPAPDRGHTDLEEMNRP